MFPRPQQLQSGLLTGSPPTWLPRRGGGFWQVPVAACDAHQFPRFADGQSEPAQQLCLGRAGPPLQPAGQLQPARLPGNLRPRRRVASAASAGSTVTVCFRLTRSSW